MKRLLTYTLLLWGVVGCGKREVLFPEPAIAQVPVRIELAWSLRPALPAGFYACFYPTESRPFVDFLDPYGGVLNLTPARYSLLVFNNDTQKVRYRNATAYAAFEAYVASVERPSLEAGGPVEQGIEEPDRLFVASWPQVEVNPTSDTLYIEQSPERLFAIYPFEVSGITGINNLSAIRASISGMAPWVRLATGELGTPAATIFLDFRRTQSGIEGGFSTFGHYADPAVPHIFTLQMVYKGRVVTRSYDVTQMLHQKERIELVESLDFPSGSGGGFDTGVGGWDKDTVDFPI